MKKRRIFKNDIKKRHLLPKPAKVADVLKDDFDREIDYDWQEEKSRRLNIQAWRRFKQQTL